MSDVKPHPKKKAPVVDDDEVNDDCQADDANLDDDRPGIIAPSVIDADAIRRARERVAKAR